MNHLLIAMKLKKIISEDSSMDSSEYDNAEAACDSESSDEEDYSTAYAECMKKKGV